ncbi:SMI1/KNR4 family protein [Streptomyces sp. NBC_00842]|uniref:SMI1/KNR4 family protein n=1 Tax=unclassified Streptomyces TaxID=2593676 RepID=UPI003868FA92
MALEQRLGTALPPSLRAFLATTNGWRHAGCFVGSSPTARWQRDPAHRRRSRRAAVNERVLMCV